MSVLTTASYTPAPYPESATRTLSWAASASRIDGSRSTALATSQKESTSAAHARSSRESPTAKHSSTRVAARAPMERDGARLRRARRHEVVAADVRQPGERLRTAVDDAVVDQAQVLVAALDQQPVNLERIDEPAEQV